MASTRDQQIMQTSDTAIDSNPLLGRSDNSENATGRSSGSRRGIISRLVRFASGRRNSRAAREPSMLVRETAAEQLEERQNGWAYSKPIVVLDLIWNLAFISVSIAALIISRDETPTNPLRVWIAGYAIQCFIHMCCVWLEYMRRRRQTNGEYASDNEDETNQRISIAKRLESANTSFSFVWWVVGFYWTTTGSQSQEAPLLFWVCVAFLAFDVFFVVICACLACVIGIAVCCCLPCIIAVMYALAEQEGASDEDIDLLPKYRFRRTGNYTASTGREMSGPSGGVMTLLSSTSGSAAERSLNAEDAECCICLSTYDDNVDLRELPCGHHFHCACIDRWLRMNSTCPLCKYNVSKNNVSGNAVV